MFAGECDGPLAVNQTGDVGCIRLGKLLDNRSPLDRYNHYPKRPPA